MKLVISMCNGEFEPPIQMQDFLALNAEIATDAMTAWLNGKPYIVGGGASPQYVNFLVELPL